MRWSLSRYFISSSVSRKITVPLLIVRTVRGFAQGLFVNTWALIVFESLVAILGSKDTPFTFFNFTMSPLQWTAASYAFGVLVGVVLEIPTSMLADAFGRRRVSIAGMYCLAFSFFAFAMVYFSRLGGSAGTVVLWAIIAETFFALYFSSMSGSFISWLNDALSEESKVHLLPKLVTRSQCAYFAASIVGAMLGIICYLTGTIAWAYFLSGAAALFASYVLRGVMQESSLYLKVKAAGAEGAPVIHRSPWKVLRVGLQTLKEYPFLWPVFLTQASVLSLTWIISSFWPIMSKSYFGSLLTDGMSPAWIGLTLVFTASPLLGGVIFDHWLNRKRQISRGSDLGVLIRIYALLNFAYVIPVFLAVYLLSNQVFCSFCDPLLCFMVLMTWHKLLPGAILPVIESLRNCVIDRPIQERSTVLSFGALLENLCAAFLVLQGAGSISNAGIGFWVYPAISVSVCTIIMLAFFYCQKAPQIYLPKTGSDNCS